MSKTAEMKDKILAIGVGRAGNIIINDLHKMGIEGIRTLAINTSQLNLDYIEADEKLLIRGPRGLGSPPEKVREAFESSKDDIKKAVGKNNVVFLIAGLGGSTGTGAIPVIARIARELGAFVISAVTWPCNVEILRIRVAEKGLEKLIKCVNTTIVLENEKGLKFSLDPK